MNYAELDRKRRPGISGKPIDGKTIRAMRDDWQRGDRPWVIAHRHSAHKNTVIKYCGHLPQHKPRRLTNAERSELLRQWA